jgi:hypothetical protein
MVLVNVPCELKIRQQSFMFRHQSAYNETACVAAASGAGDRAMDD